MRFHLTMALCVLSMASPSRAVNLVVENSILKGATDVAIGGVYYDVRFVTGNCVSIFNGCASNAEFDFFGNHQTRYRVAAQAILSQILVDGPLGNFDSNPALVFGCGNTCSIVVPSTVLTIRGITRINAAFAYNSPYFDQATLGGFDPNTNAVYARLIQTSAAVPEPSSWSMLISGFALVGMAMRRRKFASQFRA
ncbi:MAG: hypothetical protein B7Y35_04725 [Sphingomonadales bacterium 28-64-96]|nr:MAG: hypothetical protein B7Y35_04725 [Sphingomonadales bacterium 28-64-96]